MCPVQIAGALSHPEHVGAQVVIAAASGQGSETLARTADILSFTFVVGYPAGEGFFKGQQQGFVTCEKINALKGAPFHAAQGLQEFQRLPDFFQNFLIGLGACLMQFPPLRMMKVCEAPLDQSADVIQRGRCMKVGLDHTLGIGLATLLAGLQRIHQIAAIDRQFDLSATHAQPFGDAAAWFCILPGDAAHPHNGAPPAVGQHHGHLEQNAQLVGDSLGVAILELFRAVPALQQEAFTRGGLGEQGAKAIDFFRHDQRRQAAQLPQHPLQLGWVGIVRLLRGGPGLPGVGVPDCHWTSRLAGRQDSGSTGAVQR